MDDCPPNGEDTGACPGVCPKGEGAGVCPPNGDGAEAADCEPNAPPDAAPPKALVVVDVDVKGDAEDAVAEGAPNGVADGVDENGLLVCPVFPPKGEGADAN